MQQRGGEETKPVYTVEPNRNESSTRQTTTILLYVNLRHSGTGSVNSVTWLVPAPNTLSLKRTEIFRTLQCSHSVHNEDHSFSAVLEYIRCTFSEICATQIRVLQAGHKKTKSIFTPDAGALHCCWKVFLPHTQFCLISYSCNACQ